MSKDFDAIVIGAGPGGCSAAYELARRGFRVALLEQSSREQLGKPIVVEVERRAFRTCGLRPPAGEAVPYHARRARTLSSRGRPGFVVEGLYPAIAVRLDELVHRLLARAERSGVRFLPGHRVRAPMWHRGELEGVNLERAGGLNADLVIDASGYAAVLARRLDPGCNAGLDQRAEETVLAHNILCDVRPEAVQVALAKGLQAEDEVCNLLSTLGTYSTEFSFVSRHQGVAYFLVGLRQCYGQKSPALLVRDHVDARGYFGALRCSGGGRIRVRRSLDQLVSDRFMVVGEAACQVMPAHGSGVASAMIAGQLAGQTAARALAEGRAGIKDLWPYAVSYQRGRGRALACYDAAMRAIEPMTHGQCATLVESGLMDAGNVRAAAASRLPAVDLASMGRRAHALTNHPDMLAHLGRMVTAVLAVDRLYAAYPNRHDPRTLRLWKLACQRLFEGLVPWPSSCGGSEIRWATDGSP